MIYKLSDEDGFVSVVNADQYKGFVDNDWDMDQLFDHFITQMNQRNLVIWTSNEDGGGEWNVEILDAASSKPSYREFDFPIRVTGNSLYLVSYTDLTMAAQFEDEPIPAKHNKDLKLDLEKGLYTLKVRQMFDPYNFNYEEDLIHFELIFESISEDNKTAADRIFWFPED